MVQWLHGTRGKATLDTGHNPVVISTLRGTPCVELIDDYFRWSDGLAAAAMAAEQQLALITDLSEARMPPPIVRKRLIEHGAASILAEVTLAHIVVVSSLSLRALVRAFARLGQPRVQRQIVFATALDESIELALRLLWEARIPPPPGLDPRGYRTPQ